MTAVGRKKRFGQGLNRSVGIRKERADRKLRAFTLSDPIYDSVRTMDPPAASSDGWCRSQPPATEGLEASQQSITSHEKSSINIAHRCPSSNPWTTLVYRSYHFAHNPTLRDTHRSTKTKVKEGEQACESFHTQFSYLRIAGRPEKSSVYFFRPPTIFLGRN